MKFHLPKTLMLAVLAAMMSQSAHAFEYVISGDSQSVSMSDIISEANGEDVTVKLEGGELIVDTNVSDLQATGGKINITGASEITGTISGSTAISHTNGKVTLSGDNSYTGDTTINGSKAELIVGNAAALGESFVNLTAGKLDLNHMAVSNTIEMYSYGSSPVYLKNAENFSGDLVIRGSANLGKDAAANKVTITNNTVAYCNKSALTVTEFVVKDNVECVLGMQALFATPLVIRDGGKMILGSGSDVRISGSLTMGEDAQLVFTVGEKDSTQDAVLETEIQNDATITMGANASIGLSFSEDFINNISESESFTLWMFSAKDGVYGIDSNTTITTVGLDTRLWQTSDLEITIDADNKNGYVSGTISKKETIIIDSSEELSENLSDSQQNPTSVEITQDVTVSGDNSHTGGTVINNANVTLGSDTALGDGAVMTEGSSSITTDTGVVAVLPQSVQNNGSLTMSGSYDGEQLDVVSVPDTYICVNGEEGNNGFFREGGEALVVVKNNGDATLTVDGETIVTDKDGDELKLYASGLATGDLVYTTYHIVDGDHTAAMSEIQSMSEGATDTIDMQAGTLVADQSADNVQATGGTIAVQTDDAIAIDGKLSGDTTVEVTKGEVTLYGADNSQTGTTVIEGAGSKLIVGDAHALGQSMVHLKDEATLDLNNQAVSNSLYITGCTLSGAGQFQGDMIVESDHNLTLDSAATANRVTLVKGGIEGASLTANVVEVAEGAGGINSALTINPSGSIILHNGNLLAAGSTLTLGEGVTFILRGAGYAKGSVLASIGSGNTTRATDGSVVYIAPGTAILENGYGTYELVGSEIILTAVYDPQMAEALTLSNWGIITASRAFVNTIRGQRNNAACLAGGRGTAWVSVLGATHEVAGADIDLKGAAVGADMKVGKNSTVGVAVGYTDGEVKPAGMSEIEQTGTYIAAYGEHGLKKFANGSCLSLDWVAALGSTESEIGTTDWEQKHLQLNSRLGWNKQVNDRLRMTAFGGLEYFASESDQVENIKSGSLQNLRAELGVGARYVAWGGVTTTYDGKGGLQQTVGCEKLVFHGELRYMNDLKRNAPVIDMDGLRGSGTNPGHQGMGIEAGATYRFNERWSGSVNYGFNAMEDSKEHRLNVGASYTF